MKAKKNRKIDSPRKNSSGRDFEDAVERFYRKIAAIDGTKVSRNAKIEGPDGPREIDILVEGEVAGHKIRIIVECKDYSGKVNVQTIDALESKMVDVHASRAILITSKGFSKTALQKARRRGIELYVMQEALSERWHLKLEVNAVVEERIPQISINQKLKTDRTIEIKDVMTVCGVNISERFIELWNSGQLSSNNISSHEILNKMGIQQPYTTETLTGDLVQIEEIEISFSIESRYYFGSLHDKQGTMLLESATGNDHKIVLESQNIVNFRDCFVRFSSPSDIPQIPAIRIQCLAIPKFGTKDYNLEIRAKKIFD